MSKQLLNEKTFEATSVSEFTRGAPVTRTMTYVGPPCGRVPRRRVDDRLRGTGWQPAADVVAASDRFFLGYLLDRLVARGGRQPTARADRRPGLRGPDGPVDGGFISRIYEAYYDGSSGRR